jgi:hypothetical protein
MEREEPSLPAVRWIVWLDVRWVGLVIGARV